MTDSCWVTRGSKRNIGLASSRDEIMSKQRELMGDVDRVGSASLFKAEPPNNIFFVQCKLADLKI